MFNFLKKKKKKVYDKWFLLIFATVVIFLGIGNELYKGTSAVELPVNESFDDINFYKCIVDAYNEENSTEYDYAYNLTDEELASIEVVDCDGYEHSVEEKIVSTKGLEKLTSLLTLDLMGNKIIELDITNNLELLSLSVSGNKLTDINLSNNDKLNLLSAFSNELSSLDLSNNVSLNSLYLDSNRITELDLSSNLNLSHLEITGNPLVNLDITDNLNLEILRVSGNFETLDVTNNVKLIELSVSSDKLFELNVTNNILLQLLSVTGCAITDIDLSKNKDLTDLNLGNNKLVELDLSNNSKILNLNLIGNSFDKTLNLYKEQSMFLNNTVTLPNGITSNAWISNNTSVALVNDNGVVSGVSGGTAIINNEIKNDEINYQISASTVNVIDILSEEYTINELVNFVYIGNDNFDVNKIDIVGLNLNVNENKLQILNEKGNLVVELDILSINFNDLNVLDNVINITEEVIYDDFVSNIVKSEKIGYKIKDGDDEVDIDSLITDGMVLEIYIENLLLDTYEIKIIDDVNDEIVFNNNIILDDDNSYIKYKGEEVSVIDFLNNIEISENFRVFISDITGNEKGDNDLVVTGDMLTLFVGSEKKSEYKIVIRGDVNGDGRVNLTDLVQLRKHIVGWKNPETGIVENKTGLYLYAIDMNNDKIISLIDLVRVRKVLVGIDIDD